LQLPLPPAMELVGKLPKGEYPQAPPRRRDFCITIKALHDLKRPRLKFAGGRIKRVVDVPRHQAAALGKHEPNTVKATPSICCHSLLKRGPRCAVVGLCASSARLIGNLGLLVLSPLVPPANPLRKLTKESRNALLLNRRRGRLHVVGFRCYNDHRMSPL